MQCYPSCYLVTFVFVFLCSDGELAFSFVRAVGYIGQKDTYSMFDALIIALLFPISIALVTFVFVVVVLSYMLGLDIHVCFPVLFVTWRY